MCVHAQMSTWGMNFNVKFAIRDSFLGGLIIFFFFFFGYYRSQVRRMNTLQNKIYIVKNGWASTVNVNAFDYYYQSTEIKMTIFLFNWKAKNAIESTLSSPEIKKKGKENRVRFTTQTLTSYIRTTNFIHHVLVNFCFRLLPVAKVDQNLIFIWNFHASLLSSLSWFSICICWFPHPRIHTAVYKFSFIQHVFI